MRPARLRRLAQAMAGYDLVLTYNWGAMDAVLAHTLFCGAMGLAPLVHHEAATGKRLTPRQRADNKRYNAAVVAREEMLGHLAQRQRHSQKVMGK